MVAPKLLGVLHLLTQVGLIVFALVAIFSAFQAEWSNIRYGLWVLIISIIAVPLASFVIRAYFELLMVPFALSKNLRKIKKGLFGCGGDCGCGCGNEINDEMFNPEEAMFLNEFVAEIQPQQKSPVSVRPIKKKAPVKKAAPKKTTTKKPVKKGK